MSISGISTTQTDAIIHQSTAFDSHNDVANSNLCLNQKEASFFYGLETGTPQLKIPYNLPKAPSASHRVSFKDQRPAMESLQVGVGPGGPRKIPLHKIRTETLQNNRGRFVHDYIDSLNFRGSEMGVD